ncbi:unnamed protein product [Protopolystoma xenopodis]|uniref:Uncharacterized protein n=1 Tax=Protopolystoma xenopodis TaxID=117903 RepID=A0A3S5AU97_9PLAT|nr:unnamed protein product [Protopolystoma xenopodis]
MSYPTTKIVRGHAGLSDRAGLSVPLRPGLSPSNIAVSSLPVPFPQRSDAQATRLQCPTGSLLGSPPSASESTIAGISLGNGVGLTGATGTLPSRPNSSSSGHLSGLATVQEIGSTTDANPSSLVRPGIRARLSSDEARRPMAHFTASGISRPPGGETDDYDASVWPDLPPTNC